MKLQYLLSAFIVLGTFNFIACAQNTEATASAIGSQTEPAGSTIANAQDVPDEGTTDQLRSPGGPLPSSEVPVRNHVMSGNLVIAISDDEKRLWAYSKMRRAWSTSELEEPLLGGTPVVGDIVGAVYASSPSESGQTNYRNVIWAYGVKWRWQQLELVSDHKLVPEVQQDRIIVNDDGHQYVFSAATGRWDPRPEEIRREVNLLAQLPEWPVIEAGELVDVIVRLPDNPATRAVEEVEYELLKNALIVEVAEGSGSENSVPKSTVTFSLNRTHRIALTAAAERGTLRLIWKLTDKSLTNSSVDQATLSLSGLAGLAGLSPYQLGKPLEYEIQVIDPKTFGEVNSLHNIIAMGQFGTNGDKLLAAFDDQANCFVLVGDHRRMEWAKSSQSRFAEQYSRAGLFGSPNLDLPIPTHSIVVQLPVNDPEEILRIAAPGHQVDLRIHLREPVGGSTDWTVAQNAFIYMVDDRSRSTTNAGTAYFLIPERDRALKSLIEIGTLSIANPGSKHGPAYRPLGEILRLIIAHSTDAQRADTTTVPLTSEFAPLSPPPADSVLPVSPPLPQAPSLINPSSAPAEQFGVPPRSTSFLHGYQRSVLPEKGVSGTFQEQARIRQSDPSREAPADTLLKNVRVQFAGTDGVEIGWRTGRGVNEWAASQLKVPATHEFEADATYQLRVTVPIDRSVTMDCDLIVFPVTEKTKPYLEKNAILFEINRLMGHAMQHGELKQTLVLRSNDHAKQTFLMADNTPHTAKLDVQLPQYPGLVLGVIHVKGFTQHHDRSLGKTDQKAPYKWGDHQYGLRTALSGPGGSQNVPESPVFAPPTGTFPEYGPPTRWTGSAPVPAVSAFNPKGPAAAAENDELTSPQPGQASTKQEPASTGNPFDPGGGAGGNPFGGGGGLGGGLSGVGGGGFGGFGGALPTGAVPVQNHVMTSNIVVALSDDKKTLWGYSKKLGRWTKIELSDPLSDGVPVVADLVGCYCSMTGRQPGQMKYGNTVWAYSGSTGNWDKLELAEGRAAIPQVQQDMIVVNDQGKLHIFSDSTGRWASQDELLEAAQVQRESTAQNPQTLVRVYRLKFYAAREFASIIDRLFGERFGDSTHIVPDEKANQLLVNAEQNVHSQIAELIQVLDVERTEMKSSTQVNRPPTPQDAFQNWWRGAPAVPGVGGPGPGVQQVSPDVLNRQFEEHQSKSLARAKTLREGKITGTDPNDVQKRIEALKQELRREVTSAFDARQQQQKAQVAELVKRLQELQATIDAREQLKQRIIDRRVEELLDPNLKWDAPATPAPLSPAATPVTGARIGMPGPPQIPYSQPRGEQSSLSARPYVLPTGPGELSQLLSDQLQGTWKILEQQRDGETHPFKELFTLTFYDNHYEYRQGAGLPYSGGTYEIVAFSPGLKHAAIVLHREYLNGERELRDEHALIALEGNYLWICSGGNQDNVRPTNFSTVKDDGRLLHSFRRISNGQLGEGALKFEQSSYRVESAPDPPQLNSAFPQPTALPSSSSGLPGLIQSLPPMPESLAESWLNRLQGRWNVTISHQENGEIKSEEHVGLVEGTRITVSSRDGSNPMQFDLQPGSAGPPQQLDLSPVLTPEEQAEVLQERKGVLKPVFGGIIEETLAGYRICLDADGQHGRPIVFAASEATALWELKRPGALIPRFPSSGNPADALFKALIEAGHPVKAVNFTSGGRLELFGDASDEAAKKAVEDFARTLPGVTEVINSIRVGVSFVPPATGSRSRLPNRNLSDLVLDTLKENSIPDVETFTVQATSSGHVTIQGHVKSPAIRERASRIVESIEGVTTIDNYLQVVWPTEEQKAKWNSATVMVGVQGETLSRAFQWFSTGVVISADGTILTQLHGVSGVGPLQARFDDGAVVDLEIVEDAGWGLYALRPKRAVRVNFLDLGTGAKVGDNVYLITPSGGNELNLNGSSLVITRTDRRLVGVDDPVYQLNGDNQPRTTGRPIIDQEGNLAGIIVQQVPVAGTTGEPATNLCFALGAEQLRKIFTKVLPARVGVHCTLIEFGDDSVLTSLGLTDIDKSGSKFTPAPPGVRQKIQKLLDDKQVKMLAESSLVTESGREGNVFSGGQYPILIPQGDGTTRTEFREHGTRLIALPTLREDGTWEVKLSVEVSELDSSKAVTIDETTMPAVDSTRLTGTLEGETENGFVLSLTRSSRADKSSTKRVLLLVELNSADMPPAAEAPTSAMVTPSSTDQPIAKVLPQQANSTNVISKGTADDLTGVWKPVYYSREVAQVVDSIQTTALVVWGGQLSIFKDGIIQSTHAIQLDATQSPGRLVHVREPKLQGKYEIEDGVLRMEYWWDTPEEKQVFSENRVECKLISREVSPSQIGQIQMAVSLNNETSALPFSFVPRWVDDDGLKGQWNVYLEQGSEFPEVDKVVFSAGYIAGWKKNKLEFVAHYLVNMRGDPKWIDISDTESGEIKTGVYEVEGDTAYVWMKARDDFRPAQMDSKQATFTLKRAQLEEAKKELLIKLRLEESLKVMNPSGPSKETPEILLTELASDLTGVWEAVQTPPNEPISKADTRMVFWNNMWSSFEGEQMHRLWSFRVDASRSPPRISMKGLTRESVPLEGIFDLQGDMLQLRLWDGPEPENLEFGEPGVAEGTFVLKRVSQVVAQNDIAKMDSAIPATVDEPASTPADDTAGGASAAAPSGQPVSSADGRLILRLPEEYTKRFTELEQQVKEIPSIEQQVKKGYRTQAELQQALLSRQQLETLNKEFETQVKLLELAVEEARVVVENAETELSRVERLYEAGVVTPSELDVRRLALRRAEIDLEKKKTLLELYTAIRRKDSSKTDGANAVSEKPLEVLGLKLEPVSRDDQRISGKNYSGGLLIVDVVPGSVASLAGIQVGDVLLGLHTWETVSVDNFNYVLSHPELADYLPLKFYISRNGATMFGHLNLPPDALRGRAGESAGAPREPAKVDGSGAARMGVESRPSGEESIESDLQQGPAEIVPPSPPMPEPPVPDETDSAR